MARWRWGRPHAAAFPHPFFARIPVLNGLFLVAVPADGGTDTVNRGGMAIQDPDRPYRDRHGAGLRMILDFADLDSGRFIVVPGQSGNPMSHHYADLLEPWRRFSWLRLGPDTSGDTLVLEPRR
jgi:penicillin amidase